MYFVTVKEMVDYFELEDLTPEVEYKDRKITECDVNRPALQLAGFFDYFDETRLQIIGKVESTYLEKMEDEEERYRAVEKFMSYTKIPCIVVCREEIIVDKYMLECAIEKGIPIFKSKLPTTMFVAEANRWLHIQLAPRVTRHGVLVDIYGEGVLIIGESGIGKSETVLELIRRGHRLIADDAVEIKKISEKCLLGTSPEITRHFIEVRGIGIVDIKQLYGIGAVKDDKNIDLVIKLEHYAKNKDTDRMGLEDEFIKILDIEVPMNTILVRPGRNLAVLCEAAAVNFREKKTGYNAAEVLVQRISEKLERDSKNNK